jgi:hypothetical protein
VGVCNSIAPNPTQAQDAQAPGSTTSVETPTVAPGALTALLRELAATPSVPWEEQASWDVLAPGDLIADRFELAREISRGGFGVVLEAWDRQLSRRVAFKVLRPTRRSRTELDDASLREEAEVAARLHHPNIVTVFDVGSCAAGPYVILELLRGETLAARLQRGALPAREAVRVAVEMARGLEHAHRAGVVHRDLKPSNVFLCEDGSVKLLDFGVALVIGSDRSGAAGTPAYMAPEVLRGARGDERSDVFGLGAVLFEMLTARLAYEIRHGKSAALERGPEPSLEAPGVRALLAELVREMIAKDPDARPRDGGVALDRLLEVERRIMPLREDEAFETRYQYWRRALLIAAGLIALHVPLDVYYGLAVAGVRLWWVALVLAVVPVIHPRRPRLTRAALYVAGVGGSAATTAIIALCGGSSSPRFGFLLALPPMLLGFIPDLPLATVLMGLGTLCGGVGILVNEGKSAFFIAEWAWRSIEVTGFAVVGSILFRRTILGELGARRARAASRTARAAVRSVNGGGGDLGSGSDPG